ncbi:MAG: HD-GYP domain-containing protein [Syntrophaceae bacterium]|nr:HD-GYP domain-containing protein [Syntrophaceae bacterium]
MKIILPGPWYRHPFFSSKICLETEKQIEKIKDYGIRTVIFNSECGQPRKEGAGDAVDAPEKTGQTIAGYGESADPSPEQMEIRQYMEEVIHDRTMPSPEKARAVQKVSMFMMKNLLEQPTSSNIEEAKKSIGNVVDLIIRDDSTTRHLLQITSHDYQTYTHSVTVGFLGIALSKVLFKGSDEHNLHELGAGFFLHDIGKVRIDTTIINKPARLTAEEMAVMRRHPPYGYQILRDTRQLTHECRQIVLQHHERDDGKGYPLKLRGDEIHLYARLCSIADVYEALTAFRPYKRRMTTFEALRLMKDEMLNHFHKDHFDQFVRLFTDT